MLLSTPPKQIMVQQQVYCNYISCIYINYVVQFSMIPDERQIWFLFKQSQSHHFILL